MKGRDVSLRNTEVKYGSVAKWLHWTTALCVFLSYAGVYYRHYISPYCEKSISLAACSPDNVIALYAHTGFGLTVGVLVVLRLLWRWSSTIPSPEPGSRLEHIGAHAGHLGLYFFLITIPLSGWMGVMGDPNFFGLYRVTGFLNTRLYEILVTNWMGITFEQFEKPVDWFHKDLAGTYLFWALIIAHVAAGLYHHFQKNDRILVRMFPEGWLKIRHEKVQ